MNIQRIYKFHRLFGLLIALPLVAFAVSGMMHPFIANWFRPNIARTFLTTQFVADDFSTGGFAEVQAAYAQEGIRNVRPVRFNQRVYYQVEDLRGGLRYFDTQSGAELLNGDKLYAEFLARTFLNNDKATRTSIALIEEFSTEYRYINRLLPVYRVSFQDDSAYHVYVETQGSRLATFTTPLTRTYLTLFSYLHNWSFLGPKDSIVRKSVVTFFLLSAFSVAIAGLILYFPTRALHKSSRARLSFWHRTLGIIASFALGAFSLSGVWMLLDPANGEPSFRWRSKQSLFLSELLVSPRSVLAQYDGSIKGFYLARLNGNIVYALQGSTVHQKATVQVIDGKTGDVHTDGIATYVQELANSFSLYEDESVKQIERIDKFQANYPFIMKRLPVYSISYKDKEFLSYTVEPSSGYLSSRNTRTDIFRTIAFLTLHKYHFLDRFGVDVRDSTSVLTASLLIFMVVSGIWLTVRRARRLNK